MNNRDFTILNEYRKGSHKSQRELAASTGLSLGSVNSALKELEGADLIENGSITPRGYEALHPYKVDNAIILAAGLSSRFAPISYEKPKGLLKVRGEVLIERQIRQLQEAGINNITVVVGYKKGYFFYLESKFGVSIVVNNEYATRNNNASLMCVKDRLSNTYICSSDDYFTENPFEPYVYKAYYSAQFAPGKTKEWCITTGSQGRIKSVTIGGCNAWYMLGHVYFDHQFSQKFARILEDEYDREETRGKLWEELYIDHIKDLDMVIRKYPAGVIHEFDSLDELREFDPLFIENVDTDIFDNIARVLSCTKTEIHDVYPLKQGLTNLSCHFRTNSGEYVYRHPGVGTELLIDREGEVAAQNVAKAIGLDDTFIYEDPQKGWKISRYIPNCKQLDPHNPAQLARAMQMAHQLHDSSATVATTFSFYKEAKRYEKLLLEKGPIEIPDYREMAQKVDLLQSYVERDNAPTCLCHNDFFMLNFLIDENDAYYLIDWEYAGMSDYANDFGTFCVCCELNDSEIHRALEAYFGRKPTDAETRHNLALVQQAGWCWYLWSLLKEAEGDYVGEWLYTYYKYANNYLDSTIELYERANA